LPRSPTASTALVGALTARRDRAAGPRPRSAPPSAPTLAPAARAVPSLRRIKGRHPTEVEPVDGEATAPVALRRRRRPVRSGEGSNPGSVPDCRGAQRRGAARVLPIPTFPRKGGRSASALVSNIALKRDGPLPALRRRLQPAPSPGVTGDSDSGLLILRLVSR
jgi:hypothetical protein